MFIYSSPLPHHPFQQSIFCANTQLWAIPLNLQVSGATAKTVRYCERQSLLLLLAPLLPLSSNKRPTFIS